MINTQFRRGVISAGRGRRVIQMCLSFSSIKSRKQMERLASNDTY